MNSKEIGKTTKDDDAFPPDSASNSNSNVNPASSSTQPQAQVVSVAAPISGASAGTATGIFGYPTVVPNPAKRGCCKNSGECCCGFSRLCCLFTWLPVFFAIVVGCFVVFCIILLSTSAYGKTSEEDYYCCAGSSLKEEEVEVVSILSGGLCQGVHKRVDPNCTDGPACPIETRWLSSKWKNFTPQNDCYKFPVVSGGVGIFENGTCQCSTQCCNCPSKSKDRCRSGSGSRSRKGWRNSRRNSFVYIPLLSDMLSFTFNYVFPV